jgi:hypothetical protein
MQEKYLNTIIRKKTYCMLTNQRIFIRKTLQKSIHSTIPTTLKCLTVEMFSRRALFMRGHIVRDAGEELSKSRLLKVGQCRSVQTLAALPLSFLELSPSTCPSLYIYCRSNIDPDTPSTDKPVTICMISNLTVVSVLLQVWLHVVDWFLMARAYYC